MFSGTDALKNLARVTEKHLRWPLSKLWTILFLSQLISCEVTTIFQATFSVEPLRTAATNFPTKFSKETKKKKKKQFARYFRLDTIQVDNFKPCILY